MESTSHAFKAQARDALADERLQRALQNLRPAFVDNQGLAIARLPEFDALRDEARDIKDHVLAHLDFYLERFEARVVEQGGQVHWCETPAAARDAVLAICRAAGARTVTKGKSMIAEEIGLNAHLEENGIRPIETDLGEYIIQLADEPPSHLTAPAIHKTRYEIADLFRESHAWRDGARRLTDLADIVDEAREVMRARYFEADVGITGANFLIAETGSSVIVTNEGNGDLTLTLPRVHIVTASIEKIVPTLDDAMTLMRVLARSASGIEITAYNTFTTGPRRAGDLDGPEAFHVILLDNGRSRLLGGEFQDMLRCIRCGACLNHCPVYRAVGGHAYGWVYPGPMGAVLTPSLIGIEEAGHLPNASTFCGRCESVCPVRIPLPRLMRHWREREFAEGLAPQATRTALGAWAFLVRRPALYHAITGLGVRALRVLGRGRGRFRRLPLAGGWTRSRDLPAPEGPSFHAAWRARRRAGARS